MGTELVIGCPVYNRDWIFQYWVKYVERAVEKSGISNYKYVFVVDDDRPEDKQTILKYLGDKDVVIGEVTPKAKKPPTTGLSSREWDEDRYSDMANFRNNLTSLAIRSQPEYFLSLDSDILIHEDMLSNLIESQQKKSADAVGGLTYLSPTGEEHPNAAIWNNGSRSSYRRPTLKSVYKVDVLMAIKLMTHNAYTTLYTSHRYGEDFGWSENMNKDNYSMYFDARVASKHIMRPEYILVKDKRCGY